MVVLEETVTYDPYDSINELLDKLELETRAAKQMLNEPWAVQFPGQRPSPIEEPRASPLLSRQAPPPTNFAPQTINVVPQTRSLPPSHVARTQKPAVSRKQVAPTRLVASARPAAPDRYEILQMPKTPNYGSINRDLFIPMPTVRKPAELHLDDHQHRRKPSRRTRKSYNTNDTICRELRNFRESYYKGSMRECNYRAIQLEEAQMRSSRNSRLSCYY